VPSADVRLPDASPRSIDRLIALLPPHTIVLADRELPVGLRLGTPQTYAHTMSLWEQLHAPFLAAADQSPRLMLQEGTLAEGQGAPMDPRTPSGPRFQVEGALVRALVAGAPRSEVREIVREYADLLTMQGVPPERTIASLQAVARRARPRMRERDASIAGDSADDRMTLIVHWCTARLQRADSAHHSTRLPDA